MGAHVPALKAGASVVMEVIPTLFLMFVILGAAGYLNAAPSAAAINRQPSSGLAVGAVVGLAIWFAGPTSNLIGRSQTGDGVQPRLLGGVQRHLIGPGSNRRRPLLR